ncbi:hypothetical protein QEH42_gp219 [Microbacterium phage Pumpernickel]|uniref:Uncharacterized protein n=1 Tax=Microbacterium phage Pumpernickel TaxID=2885983 RepID=A0AAE8Y797_9CAUD|nr:hypothetical protein QEH42_gp219 [Microbacterium phage Pumpernickel]UDL15999.1 hypothetical protein SEA_PUMPERNICKEL_249 [Microbacterium phage Pumpernickel]
MSRWEDVEKGDLIRVEMGEQIMQGRVDYLSRSADSLALINSGWLIKNLEKEGYSIDILEKHKYTVPTEEGLYINSQRTKVYSAKMDPNGLDLEWVDITRGGVVKVIPVADLPLDRFHPRKDTIKEVRDWFLSGEFSWGTVDKDSEMIRSLDKHFGLEDT